MDSCRYCTQGDLWSDGCRLNTRGIPGLDLCKMCNLVPCVLCSHTCNTRGMISGSLCRLCTQGRHE